MTDYAQTYGALRNRVSDLVRGADEENFTSTTKKMPVEAFEDPNANVLFYITETGIVATAGLPIGVGTDTDALRRLR